MNNNYYKEFNNNPIYTTTQPSYQIIQNTLIKIKN